ncbi:MAG: hypothetical protein ACK5XZ_00950 [Hyphomonadaceae bacterium]|nr:hypothetical protein [Aquidulcibacter sp.]
MRSSDIGAVSCFGHFWRYDYDSLLNPAFARAQSTSVSKRTLAPNGRVMIYVLNEAEDQSFR